MSLSIFNEHENEELRERCLKLAAEVFKKPSVTAQNLTITAEHFYQYIKNGGDTECDYVPDPVTPVNTGPGMAVIRESAEITDDGVHMA